MGDRLKNAIEKVTLYWRHNKRSLHNNVLVIGVLSAIWYIFRTGTKPSRASYPCQKVAASNVQIMAALYVIPLVEFVRRKITKPIAVFLAFLFVMATVTPMYINNIPLNAYGVDVNIDLYEQTAISTPSSDVFVVTDTTGADDGVDRLLVLMGSKGLKYYKSSTVGTNSGPDGIIGSDDVIMIKINSQWDQRGGTNTDLLKTVIEAITNHPDGFTGEVVVVDNGQGWLGPAPGGSFDWGTNNNAIDHSQSVQDVVDSFTSPSYEVSTKNWQDFTLTEVTEYDSGEPDADTDGYIFTDIPYAGTSSNFVTYPKFQTDRGTKISFKYGIWDGSSFSNDNLILINIPVLKSHVNYGVTGAVKNYMGVPSQRLKATSNAHSWVGTGGMGTLMVNTRIPDLNILDCIWINARPGLYYDSQDSGWQAAGPSTLYNQATELDIIVAGTDPVAIDYWASKNILLQTALAIPEYSDLRLNLLNPDNSTSETYRFAYWLDATNTILNTAGKNTVKNDDNINVYIKTGNVNPSVAYIRAYDVDNKARIDPAGDIPRGGTVRMYTRVSDVETASESLTVTISYKPSASGTWTEAAPPVYNVAWNYWASDWTIPGDATTGLYDVKVDVVDPDTGTETLTGLEEYNIIIPP